MPKGNYKLAADIDLAGIAWSTAPIPFFSGSFYSDNKKITNLTINGGSNLGLFGSTNEYSNYIQISPGKRQHHSVLTASAV